MRKPGFSTEASIYPGSAQYRVPARHTPSEARTIELRSGFWTGPFIDLGCTSAMRIYQGTMRGGSYEDCISTPHPSSINLPGSPGLLKPYSCRSLAWHGTWEGYFANVHDPRCW